MFSDWQERITCETPPAILAEHVLRYRLAASLISRSAAWLDLGCGNGLAPAIALGRRTPARTILVDLDAAAAERAAAELGARDAILIECDLTDAAALERVGDRLLATDGDRVVTCFEVVEHLSTFVPLLQWAGDLARSGQATFLISVPNDAFWAIENPYHAGRWSEGALDELRRLLPDEQTLMRQVSLTGSAVVGWGSDGERHDVPVEVGGEGTVATHFIAGFGPRHRELRLEATVVMDDQLEQRRWERQRESNLAFAEAVIERVGAEREEWRRYIHELERELGRPLSGVEAPPPSP